MTQQLSAGWGQLQTRSDPARKYGVTGLKRTSVDGVVAGVLAALYFPFDS
ncbi:hypothetical protein PSAC2689_100189 [Paraburkholderia sacchari]